MKKIAIIFFCFELISLLANANQIPRSLATDQRIKIVAYNPNDVVTIIGNHLISTAIYFAQKENIVHIDIGDPLSWKVAPISSESPNVLFVTPQLPQSDTNMTVITNQRTYAFRLITHQNDMPTSNNVTYALQFKYPQDEQAELQEQLNSLQKTFLGNTHSDPVQWNYDYSFYRNKGSPRIAPIQAVDNGTFTIFKFAKNVNIPAIFSVDTHQNEALLNFRTQGDFIFIQGVHRQYTLRNGDDVISVYNDAFSR